MFEVLYNLTQVLATGKGKRRVAMAKIIAESGEVELPDGSPIITACEQLGVPFGCRAGQCGTCIITVEEGYHNLEPKNSLEEDMGLRENQRLACQAKIKSGNVRIRW